MTFRDSCSTSLFYFQQLLVLGRTNNYCVYLVKVRVRKKNGVYVSIYSVSDFVVMFYFGGLYLV
jgi:hypothetical protein